MNSTPSPYPPMTLTAVFAGLRGALGGWYLRGLLSHALMWMMYRRLGTLSGQMERLVARFAAGKLWRRAPRVVSGDPVVAEAVDRPRVARLWPGGFGWLVRLGSWQAGGFCAQLKGVLAQEQMVALLAASPQAVRLLRPWCRALAVDPSFLPRRVSDRPARPDPETSDPGEPVAKRVRKKRVPIDWGRIPLPRGVLSAVRRAGFRRDW